MILTNLNTRFIGLLFRSLWSEASYWLLLFPFYINFQWHSLYCVKFWDSFIWLQGKTIDVDFSQQKLMKLHIKFDNYPFELSPFRESRCKMKSNHVMMAKMLLNTLTTKQGIFISLIYLFGYIEWLDSLPQGFMKKKEENTKIGTKTSQEQLSNISGRFFRQKYFLETGGGVQPIPPKNGIFGQKTLLSPLWSFFF